MSNLSSSLASFLGEDNAHDILNDTEKISEMMDDDEI